MMESIKSKFENITEQLNQINPGIQVIAVTKQVGNERTQEAVDAGITHLGENRPDGLLQKREAIHADVDWHFIGNLQTRKVKDIINEIDFLHSLDRLSLAKEIQKRAEKPVRCFVQVNVSGEESKSGVSAEEAVEFVRSLADFDKIQVVGLMTMAPISEDEGLIRRVFSGLKKLQMEIAKNGWDHAPCMECSMGMSGDYMIAAEEGASFVRIGTALVGTESEVEG